jgi:predicted lipase
MFALALLVASQVSAAPSSWSMSSFSSSGAVQYAKYSFSSYCPSDQIAKWNCRLCASSNQFEVKYTTGNSENPVFGYIGVDRQRKEIVSVFRGTVGGSLDNWFSNLDATQAPASFNSLESCNVHEGYFNDYLSVRDGIIESIEGVAKSFPDYSIVLTGHSRGAALATLMAADLLFSDDSYRNRTNLITFGSPRVGDPCFASALTNALLEQGNSWRVTRGADPVAHCNK